MLAGTRRPNGVGHSRPVLAVAVRMRRPWIQEPVERVTGDRRAVLLLAVLGLFLVVRIGFRQQLAGALV